MSKDGKLAWLHRKFPSLMMWSTVGGGGEGGWSYLHVVVHSKPIVVWNTAPVPEFLTNTRLSTETLILRLCRFADLARKAEVYTGVNLFLVSLQYQALRNVNQPNLQTPNMVIHTSDENNSNYEYQIYAGHLKPNPWSPPDSDRTYIYIIFSIWNTNLFLHDIMTMIQMVYTCSDNIRFVKTLQRFPERQGV